MINRSFKSLKKNVMGLQLQLLSSYSVECFELRHGKYGNPVGELLTRSKQGSQLYYEVRRFPVCLRLRLGRMVQLQRLFGMWNHCDLWYFCHFLLKLVRFYWHTHDMSCNNR